MRKVFLDDLPRINNIGHICWADTVGTKLKFIYDDIEGEIDVLDYKTNGSNPKLYLNYNGNKKWVQGESIRKATIGGLLRIKKKTKPLSPFTRVDIVGKRFGKLVVVGDDGTRTNNGSIMWHCSCDCGETTHATAAKLESGAKKSCGCLARNHFKPKSTTDIDFANTAKSVILGRYKSKAKQRNFSWNISREIFEELIEQPCYYCGNTYSLVYENKGHKYKHNGIDRIDSNIGYEDDNVVPCCRWCNQAKSIMTQKEFYNWVQQISKNFTLNKVS